MKTITFGKTKVVEGLDCYVIAEIGHNHQGDFNKAVQLIEEAASCGADAVKFQKRNNKALFTKAMYNKPYDNENSYGSTYGEHREFLEFGWDEYFKLKQCAEENGVEFMVTAFDFDSVDFLERLGINTYKLASGDLTSLPLIEYIAKLKKPMILSTGASTLDEVRMAYEAILKHHDQICLLHAVCAYPADYDQLNLNVIPTLKREFPEAMIGYSGHDNGILAAVIARMLGAAVIEKHFTLNRAWKGTDHKFSLEPTGLRKQVRDLKRVPLALGGSEKQIYGFEKDVRGKMGKSIYASRPLTQGTVITSGDIVFKSPGGFLPPYEAYKIIGATLTRDLDAETPLSLDVLEGSGCVKKG